MAQARSRCSWCGRGSCADVPPHRRPAKPPAGRASSRSSSRRSSSRDYDEWREAASGVAFHAAAFGLAGGVTVASRLAEDASAYWDCLQIQAPQPIREPDVDLIAAVLADRAAGLARRPRRPASAPAGRYPLGSPDVAYWPRTLVRLGAIARPDLPGVHHPDARRVRPLSPLSASGLAHPRGQPVPRLRPKRCCADPGLLDDEVWRLFAVPGRGAGSRAGRPHGPLGAGHRSRTRQTWSESLAHLCHAGKARP